MTAIAPPHLAPHTGIATGLQSLLNCTAFAPLEQTGWIEVTGSDRVRWLNGMTTNSIQQLQSGEGNYNFLLSAQGRIQGDAYAFAQPDHLLLETDRSRLRALVELLDRFIIMDDVELKDLTADRHGILVAGPTAAATLAGLGIEAPSTTDLRLSKIQWQQAEITLIHAHSPLVPRFELWSDPATAEALRDALASVATLATEADLEHLRLLEGTPRYGTDIRDRELPQETEQTRALHFAKGCYLGQEIVERIRSRGQVHRLFHAFTLSGDLPTPGTALESNGKSVGEITSAARIELPTGPIQLALGYIRREALSPASSPTSGPTPASAAPLDYPGGQAQPVPTPFRAAAETR